MADEIVPFVFEGFEIRVAGSSDNPLWVASDVCTILGLDTSVAINGRPDRPGSGLDDDEKGTALVSTLGGSQEMLTVNEPGLYRLIFKSRKPIAKRFQRWIAHEVIPAIRKTGSYSVHQQTPTLTKIQMIAQLAQQMVEQEQRMILLESKAVEYKQKADQLEVQVNALESNQKDVHSLASHADAEVMRYRHGRMEHGDWFSIKGWASLHKVRLGRSKEESRRNASALGKAATAWCRENGFSKEFAFDPDYGSVGIYPQNALIHAYAKVLNVITSKISA